jgi:hypothetical protein
MMEITKVTMIVVHHVKMSSVETVLSKQTNSVMMATERITTSVKTHVRHHHQVLSVETERRSKANSATTETL